MVSRYQVGYKRASTRVPLPSECPAPLPPRRVRVGVVARTSRPPRGGDRRARLPTAFSLLCLGPRVVPPPLRVTQPHPPPRPAPSSCVKRPPGRGPGSSPSGSEWFGEMMELDGLLVRKACESLEEWILGFSGSHASLRI